MYESCLNCGGYTFKEKCYLKHLSRHIVTCQKCGLVQVNPRNEMLNIIDSEDASQRDDKLSGLLKVMEKDTGIKMKDLMEKEVETRKQYFRTKIKDIEKYKKNGKLLDVGCAQGAFLSACSSSNYQLYGLEPSKYTYQEALKIAPESTIYNSTLHEMQFPSNNFEVVTIFSTIEHLLNPRETIAEAYRILKKGGILVIETPDINNVIYYILGKKWMPLLVPDHVTFFSKAVLTKMLKETGFDVLEVKSSFRIVSVRLLLFHLRHLWSGFMLLSRALMKISEKINFAQKAVYIPRFDEMVLFAVKPK